MSERFLVPLGFMFVGLGLFTLGWRWRMGKLGKGRGYPDARAILLEPIGLCWALIGGGYLLDLAGVPRAFVGPLWFIGLVVFYWGFVLGMITPDWYKPRWMLREDRAMGRRPWKRWNRFWLWATALFGLLAFIMAALMLVAGLDSGT